MSDSCGCGSTVDIRALEAGQRRVLMIRKLPRQADTSEVEILAW